MTGILTGSGIAAMTPAHSAYYRHHDEDPVRSRDRGPWIQLAGGGRWWPLDPRPQDVVWRDVAEALGKMARFSGHTCTEPYSVAQHCLHVADLLPPGLRLHGLLHDAHEAVIGADMPSPLKRAMPAAVRDWWDQLEDMADRALWAAAGLDVPSPAAAEAIRHADLVALATERRDLLAPCVVPWEVPLPPPDTTDTLRPVPWHQASDSWLTAVRRLLPPTALVPA